MKVLKSNDKLESFDINKIKVAIEKAYLSCGLENVPSLLYDRVEDIFIHGTQKDYTTEEIHNIVEEVIADFNAKIVDSTGGCFVVELSETPNRIDEFLDKVKGFGLIEMCRSGAIAMERGSVTYEI
jgi:acetolactate synthase small subunit